MIAKAIGCTIKLLGIAETLSGNKLQAFVSPTLVPLTNPIGSVNGALNVVQVCVYGCVCAHPDTFLSHPCAIAWGSLSVLLRMQLCRQCVGGVFNEHANSAAHFVCAFGILVQSCPAAQVTGTCGLVCAYVCAGTG